MHREPIDFRSGINSPVTLVEQTMQLDPLAEVVLRFPQPQAQAQSSKATTL
ncbi:hypothetical protein [Caballeronia terrestris]|uniref:hypothetical protein n=1 Tax=Caballeronia terrestris TaxID=1226301 RepID=UPI0035B525FA